MKCVVGLSGGVDSSVAAFLMKKRGYKVTGCVLKLFNDEKANISIQDAINVANFLEIPIQIIDCTKDFNKHVIEYFIDYYKNGKTPSPCIICNKFIKFKYLDEFRKAQKADLLVTGHYAKIEKQGQLAELYEGANRDQSYFLYAVDQNILAHTEFPLGAFNDKSITRNIARNIGIQVAEKPDSQEICFIPNNNRISFIKEKLKRIFELKCGDIISADGKILGQHKGIINYTIGQRKGLGLSGGPFFVCKIDAAQNKVIVSKKESIRVKKIRLNNTKFISHPFEGKCQIKIRSNGEKVKANIFYNSNYGNWEAYLLEPEYGAAKGQHCVFYDKNKILGGGEII